MKKGIARKIGNGKEWQGIKNSLLFPPLPFLSLFSLEEL